MWTPSRTEECHLSTNKPEQWLGTMCIQASPKLCNGMGNAKCTGSAAARRGRGKKRKKKGKKQQQEKQKEDTKKKKQEAAEVPSFTKSHKLYK